MDQHGTEGQTHGRAGGVRDAQTGFWGRPMIQYRRTHPMAPGRQADAIALAKDWAAVWKEAAGVDLRISIVMTGTLGVGCVSGDFESMGAFEEARAKVDASPESKAFLKKYDDGIMRFIPNTVHEEFWRDA